MIKRSTLPALAFALVLCVCDVGNSQEKERQKVTTFGHRQVDQMLSDRPSMRDIIKPGSKIYARVIDGFNSGDDGERVHWHDKEPFSGQAAEHQAGFGTMPALVRISAKEEYTGRDRWYSLVFEFENIRNTDAFLKLGNLAIQKKIDRKAFSRKCVELEFRAGMRTNEFFCDYPIPGSNDQNAPNYTRYLLMLDDFDGYFESLESTPQGEYDPREYFGASYDRLLGREMNRSIQD